ncbi:MAG: class I SAM-dependent methyltransferase [Geothermobacteraceae bacterium]
MILPPLDDIIGWSHRLLAEVVRPGDALVDLTAGNGHDTLALARLLEGKGQLLAFDIQEVALDATASRLAEAGLTCRRIAAAQTLESDGLFLIHDSHHHLDRYLSRGLNGAIANLGYLPGGDKNLITRAETTVRALEQVLDALVPGGRLAVVVYPGHPGAEEEVAAVEALVSALPAADYDVLRMVAANRRRAPFLLTVGRRRVEIAG